MNQIFIQIAAAFFGSIGFAIFLKIKGIQILYAGIGGMLTWGIYLAAYDFVQSYFFGNLIASIFVAAYAEIMARVNKAPSTIFLTASAITLIPGSNLYKMMYALVNQNYEDAGTNGVTALVISLAIGLGFVIVAVFNRYLTGFTGRIRSGKSL
ncbi:MAG: threonine/serine exporter family protein [Hornefia sp.]|nr:threonine/serine exporter family protein [Hornefia sp.]